MTTAGAADPGSWNRYAYAGNDPANSNDPSGLCIINGEEFRDPCFLANAYTSYDGGGGGGSGGPHRAYSDSDRPVRDSGGGDPIWSLMHSAVAMAIKALTSNEDCRGIFGNKDTRAGNFDPVKVLNSIFGSPNGGQYGKVSFLNLSPLGPVAVTVPVLTVLSPFFPPIAGLAVNVVINSTTSAPDTNAWNNGDTFQNAVTLLHELGHAYDDLFGSGGSSIKRDPFGIGSGANDDLVIQKCFTVHRP